MALINSTWGIDSMSLEIDKYGEFKKVDFTNEWRPAYRINITGSSPQGIIKDVMRFINEKGKRW